MKNNIKQKEPVNLHVETQDNALFSSFQNILQRQDNAKEILFVSKPVVNCLSAVVGTTKLYVEAENPVDSSGQKDELKKELDYLKGFLISVDKKLSNERFVQNAKPEVVDIEKKKKTDAEQKIKAIEESLAALG